MKCKMCGKPLKKFTRTWWERMDNPKLRPVVGKAIPHEGLVQQILRTKGEPGDQRVTYWTGQVGYGGRGHLCSLKCGYEWAMDEIRQQGWVQ
jgi:hypothetical protein